MEDRTLDNDASDKRETAHKTVPEQFGNIALGFAEIVRKMSESKKNQEKAK